ncbi:MAG TPA: UDP-N-acetylmuramoyl-L-alanyl-D-glutamate--2,6-diaminopimelate ligase [Bacillota bacterium]|nr:UDP-N-acetylmuramoyl-L-alanyl-D-glutamate--2,6-diaminopimelate ligase [Bacillota bacterium]
MKRLKSLIVQSGVRPYSLTGNTGVEIQGITYDSRKIAPGYLFVCIRGEHHDGHAYIPEAASKGAAAVVIDSDTEIPDTLSAVRVSDSRKALGDIAKAFYDNPSASMFCIGVTGTKGKTTTTHLIKSVLDEAGMSCGVIGTLGCISRNLVIPAKHTTPESSDIQEFLAKMRASEEKAVAIEVSSHAIDLQRIRGVDFDVGVFTNIGHDHLDFHGSFSDYLATKASFFENLGTIPDSRKNGEEARISIINVDDPNSGFILSKTHTQVLTYGISDASASITAKEIRLCGKTTSFVASTPHASFPVSLNLKGIFNVYNALAAIACGLAKGLDPDTISSGLRSLKGVPGRFEAVDEGQPFSVIVDYAHTPDSLESVLREARRLGSGCLTVVFGCGGDRDRSKRPAMGKIAATLADRVIVTTDNPRTEEPYDICKEIEKGILQVGRPRLGYEIILDRASAIQSAIFSAQEGDVLIIAGKGHETYQIFRDTTIHFDDREVAKSLLRERMENA